MRSATLYRMKTEKHICPFGLKAKSLLSSEGFTVEDILLTSRGEVDSFKEQYSVDTTPQVFIGDKRIGGYDDLVQHLGKVTLKQSGITYQPLLAIFGASFAMAVAVSSAVNGGALLIVPVTEQFIAISMCMLAVMKLRDLYSFTNQFLGYDLLAQKWVPYAYLYPFVELAAGVCMIAKILLWLAAPAALFIGAVGAISVIKAVWIDRRDLKCACVGGDSSVPLGAISLAENLAMVAMAIWILA